MRATAGAFAGGMFYAAVLVILGFPVVAIAVIVLVSAAFALAARWWARRGARPNGC